MIVFKNSNIEIRFKGLVKRIPTIRGHNVVETVHGVEKTEKVRSVVNLEITIQYINEDEYNKLVSLFMSSSNTIDVTDTDRGSYFTKYSIGGDTLELDEKIDMETNGYYYMGALRLNKR